MPDYLIHDLTRLLIGLLILAGAAYLLLAVYSLRCWHDEVRREREERERVADTMRDVIR